MNSVRIIINMNKPQASEVFHKVRVMLEQAGFRIGPRPDFVIAIGGDGTILMAAHRFGRQALPILGLNIGGLGFLTDVKVEELAPLLSAIRRRQYRIEKRMILRARSRGRSLYALNDLTVCTRVPGRSVEFVARIDGEYISRFIADGVICATPTGSTAYSLACGGPILRPEAEAIIMTALAPHTLSVRPLVLPASSRIEIEIGRKGRGVLVADGQRSRILDAGQKIFIERADYDVRLLKSRPNTFFKTLREKLKWGGREDA